MDVPKGLNNIGWFNLGPRPGENGKNIPFVVRKTQIYKQNSDASEVFISNDDKAHLNLVTCQGIWNKKTRSYPNRLVIFTDKE